VTSNLPSPEIDDRVDEPGIVRAGWRLLWQTQRILWWVYAVNLVLGFFSAVALAVRVGSLLNHSLAAERLYHGFDVATFLDLGTSPEVQLASRPLSSLPFVAIFFVFMLFATGGILESYARNRMLVPGEFFQGCGAFFWRFVRLLACFLVVLTPVMVLNSVFNRLASNVAQHASKLGFRIVEAGGLIVLLILMALRLWFDMAQVMTVVEDERRVTRMLGRAFRLTKAGFGPLFWMYARLSALTWLGTALAVWFWLNLSAERIGMSFLVAQFVAFLWIATRLWQRACEMVWYQRKRPVPEPVAVPEQVIDEQEPPTPQEFQAYAPES
jgi:hypothetical protein